MQTQNRRRVAAVTLAVALAGAASPAGGNPAPRHPKDPRPYCRHRLFTVREAERAASVVYRGARTATRRNVRMLGQMERCQRNPAAQGFVRGYDRRAAAANAQRAYDASRPSLSAVASFFDDSGATASGEHFAYGYASCGSEGVGCWAFGTRVEFCWQGRCVVGEREDSGPYGAGRSFDLNTAMADALGMQNAGVVSLSYRVLG